jgi:putative DNA primase/helicase
MKIKKGAYAPLVSACLEKAEITFLNAMEAKFGRLNFIPIADGMRHRFHVPGDKPGSKNGAYALYPGTIDHGWFGTWKNPTWHKWNSRKPVNLLEAAFVRQRTEQAKSQRDTETIHIQQRAAEHANRLWEQADRAVPNHPYLVAKGCQPHNLRQDRDLLLVPLYFDGQLVNLQRIHIGGTKRFLTGGRIKGCYSALGSIKAGKPLYVCEGWATGATIYEEEGHAVGCAMTAQNLFDVARHLKRCYPATILIIAGDDDRTTPGNPGKTAAEKAAFNLGCQLINPQWPVDAPLHLSDFNDLRQWLKESKA